MNNKHKFFLIKIKGHIISNNAGMTNLMHLNPLVYIYQSNVFKKGMQQNCKKGISICIDMCHLNFILFFTFVLH